MYASLLPQLVVERQLRVLVHPVPPVLPGCMQLVRVFNNAVASQVAALLQQQPELRGRLAFLDALVLSISQQGGQLAPRLVLDGTHLHPRYLSHLEAALAAAGVFGDDGSHQGWRKG